MVTFDELINGWNWKPIRNCPGRYILYDETEYLNLKQLLGTDAEVRAFQVTRARDTVLVAGLDKGRLITYKRADGTSLHTLNTAEGFERKLKELGIDLEDGRD